MKKLSILLTAVIFTLAFTAGCGNFKFPTFGGSSSHSQKTDFLNPSLPSGTHRAEANVVSPERLAEIQRAKEEAEGNEYENYVDAVKAVDRIKNSVVRVTASGGGGSASGVVWSAGEIVSDGETSTKVSYVLTAHVNIAGSTDVTVETRSGETYSAWLIGSDPDSDVTVMCVEAELDAVEIYTDTDLLKGGEGVFAVSYALDYPQSVATSGIVGAPSGEINLGTRKATLLPHDAAMGASSTGGGLFTDTGLFIGMLDYGFDSGVSGLNFAVPANEAGKIANMLIETHNEYGSLGYVVGKYRLGVKVEKIIADLWGVTERVRIVELDPTGCFARSGFRVNDEIVSFNYREKEYAAAYDGFFELLDSFDLQINDVLYFTVLRGENRTPTQVNLTIYQYIYGT